MIDFLKTLFLGIGLAYGPIGLITAVLVVFLLSIFLLGLLGLTIVLFAKLLFDKPPVSSK